MEEDKNGVDKFMNIDKFITELIGYHEQIKQLKASEVHYKDLAGTLQETLKKYQTIIDHLPQKIFLKDKNLFYLFSNENYARFLGVDPLKIPGKTDHDFFPFETAEQYLNDDRMFMEKGQPEEKEEKILRDGKERVDQVAKFPIRNDAGEGAGILEISWDITDKKERIEDLERKSMEFARLLEARTDEWKEICEKFQSEQAERRRLEERLNSLEGYYRILFENTGTAVAVVEDNKVVSRVNTEFERFSGYSRAEVEGAKNWNEFIHNGSPQNMGEATSSPDMISPDPGMQVFKFVDKQNREKTVSMTASRIPDTNRVMISLMDITKYKQAREGLNRIMKQFMELMVEMERGVKNLDG
jgi:PAS domain S-box-containing protein